MNRKDFYFDLPEELIAQTPLGERDASRLLVLDRISGDIEHKKFIDVLDYFRRGDTLVLNNTRVIPARLFGHREHSLSKVEILLLKRLNGDWWEALVKPGRHARIGHRIIFGGGLLTGKILDILEDGTRVIDFEYDGIFEEILDQLGTMPLPPYIKSQLEDKERYQTIYSKIEGSVAAPTAGLHFTKEILNSLKDKGVNIAFITLHVGLGTFRPVKVERIEEHHMHSEYYEISDEVANIINQTKRDKRRVVAVGTTTVRTLESVATGMDQMKGDSGWTNIFIYPGYKYKIVDAMITNFHLPESTLLMLVSAFAGKDKILNAYGEAIKKSIDSLALVIAC